MSVLNWDKPKKVQTTQEWKEGYGFEGGPTGGYMPNMSDEDAKSWKAKVTGTKIGFPIVEIRKQCRNGTLLFIIVSLGGGFKYKWYDSNQTTGVNVHMSANGPIWLDFAEMTEMQQAVAEGEARLKSNALDKA